MLFVLGSVFGSFFNVCILRIPEGTFWQKQRSTCPQCDTTIPFYHNIPILSFFLLRGRSACCQKPISWQYPLVELAGGLIFGLVFIKFPFVKVINQDVSFQPDLVIRYIHAVVFCSLLLVASVIDLYHMIIPDVISLGMIVLSPIVAYFHPSLTLIDSGLGVILGGGFLYLIAWLYWIIRKEIGMGFGDVKLLAGIGGWLGYKAVFPTIFYSSILGAGIGIIFIIISKNRSLKTAIPFGPFLALGAILHLLFGYNLLFM